MKKVNKGARRRLLLFFSIFILLLGYIGSFTFSYWKQILINREETKKLKLRYKELLTDKETLENDVVKLQDPDYVAKYAREKYLYSKDGELIIKIIDENE